MMFFTNYGTKISRFCLLNIKDYHKPKTNKKIIFVDPSVYELVENEEYSRIDQLHELAAGNLQKNEYISIDYPCDMNEKYTDVFIEKTWALRKCF